MSYELNFRKPYQFSKTRRLLSSHDYKTVFDRVDCKQGGKFFTILSTANDRSLSRLGLIIAKKHVPLAVERNALKRRVRETFRIAFPGNQKDSKAFDVVVLSKPASKHLKRDDISLELNKQWHKFKQKKNANQA